MSADLPSPPAHTPRGQHHPLPVEALQEHLGGLLREREALRLAGAAAVVLEENRLAIVAVNQMLARALFAAHRP